MALQDLTPQLRTRLSRLERLVGWFVAAATVLLLIGLVYYVHNLAERRGWFLTRLYYFTFVRNATGLKVGDRVKMMGFDVGDITEITPQPPGDLFDVYVRFRIYEPHYGYLWSDSEAKVGAADFLGNRFVEVMKGTNGTPTYALHELREVTLGEAWKLVGGTNYFVFGQDVYDGSNLLVSASQYLSQPALSNLAAASITSFQVINKNVAIKPPKWIWDEKAGKYRPYTEKDKGYWIYADESPALTERLEKVVTTVERSLPDFLALTNSLARVLTNASAIVMHADDLLLSAKPVVTNFAQITANLSGPKGSLGEWLLPTNINLQLQNTLGSANTTLLTANSSIHALSSNLLVSLENVASLTSNLSAQVQANGLVLTELSDLIVHTDEMVQGLKRHWLLKGSFRAETNQTIESILKPRVGEGK